MIPTRSLLLALLLTAPLAAEAAPPSFDCAKAKLPVEKAICRSAELSAYDVEIAQAYARAMQNLGDPMRETLRRAQRLFVAARNDAFGLPDDDLSGRLTDQIAFLKSIETRGRSTVEGSWRNGLGVVEVTKKPDGNAEVLIGTADPVRARWLCDVQVDARQVGAEWHLLLDRDTAAGWKVALSTAGGQLTVKATPPAGAVGEPLFCGNGGTVDGDYLPVRPDESAN